jgi:hypothetical protein
MGLTCALPSQGVVGLFGSLMPILWSTKGSSLGSDMLQIVHMSYKVLDRTNKGEDLLWRDHERRYQIGRLQKGI